MCQNNLNMSDKLECRRPTGDTMTPLSQFYQSIEMSHISLVSNTAHNYYDAVDWETVQSRSQYVFESRQCRRYEFV